MFYVTKPLPTTDPNREKNGICQCGRKVDLACDAPGCPCYDNKVACWKKDECKCQNCNNPYGSRLLTREKETACQCTKGCNAYKCPCWRCGASCMTDPR